MRVINAGYEYIPPVDSTNGEIPILKHLEKIGRICYKSEDKITDDSCVKFIDMLAQRGHWAMLEHHTFVLQISEELFRDLMNPKWLRNARIANAMAFIKVTLDIDPATCDDRFLVSGSVTAFNNLWDAITINGVPHRQTAVDVICSFLHQTSSVLLVDPREDRNHLNYNGELRLLSSEEIRNLPIGVRMVHEYFSVKFTVDRGVTHELVRHRPVAWAQESTRYCNYSKGKHGNETTVIKPCFWKEDSFQYAAWYDTCLNNEKQYIYLTEELKVSAQEARSILTNSIKADIVMTATLSRWNHFFKMRVSDTAHPQMREVTIPLLHDMKKIYPGAFDDIEPGHIVIDGIPYLVGIDPAAGGGEFNA